MNKIWEWFMIVLIGIGAGSTVILGVIILYLLAGYHHLVERCSEY